MTTNTRRDLSASELRLKRDLEPFFAKLASRAVPDAIVSSIHSSGHCEDGSFLLTLHCADGSTMHVAATVGERLRVVVQPHPH